MRKAVAVLCSATLGLGALGMAGCAKGSSDTPAATETPQTASDTRVFTDSLGREVELPAHITRICPSGHTAQQVLLTMAPDLMVGLSQKLNDDQLKVFGDQFKDYPVFGAVLGAKDDFNREAVAAAAPQVIIDTGEVKKDSVERLDALQEQLGIPVVFVKAYLEDYGDTYKTLGELLGREDRGNQLSEYCSSVYKTTQDAMAAIPESERVRAAYLLGENGLNAIAKTSGQAQVVDMVSDNVAVVDNASGKGSGNEVSLEQIALWNPDLIIFQKGSVYDAVGSDPAWAGISAISSGNYYEVPNSPWCWMNNPPTVNQLLGMQWFARLLYPNAFDDSIQDAAKTYYKTMYGYDLGDEELSELLKNSLPKAAR
ncbi:ABC transporter substrate-binding protein [Berryella intestinalis]|uniref:ABC transporter substrate-binding protein n=1 Tax=Berryella intestinalis TaxID=1531429 RepID=A0A0A8B913_9ACTN|nr:ABC transporter substrate-binding protein [Berryella intestinalis]AJC11557.1 ABC transporter substrate-binding protein [Berryella intestinalis]